MHQHERQEINVLVPMKGIKPQGSLTACYSDKSDSGGHRFESYHGLQLKI